MGGFPYAKRARLPSDAYSNRENVFHVVSRAAPGTRPFVGPVGRLVWTRLRSDCDREEAVVSAACLMPDHLHLIVAPGTTNLVSWIGTLKSSTTRCGLAVGGPRALWQPSFYDRRLRDALEVKAALEYVC